jgi:Uma2 family endonuclease
MTIQEIREAISHLTRVEREDLAEWILNSAEFDSRVAEAAVPYGQSRKSGYMTADEYLDFELSSPVKHEYVAGLIFAMTGVRFHHAVIVGDLMLHLKSHLRGGPCEAISNDMKVHICVEESEFYYYPDVVVTCEPQGGQSLVLNKPRLIIEVLSPSTERTDRSEKCLNYRHIVSLEEYVLVAQRPYEVTLHRRSDNWRPLVLTTPDSIVEFRSVGFSIKLEQIYERVK